MRFLRRSANLLKRQNWFAYLIEVCIVVLSVYIAYQLTVWNENTKSKVVKRIMLENLYSENNINIHELGGLNDYRNDIVVSTNRLLNQLNNGESVPEDTLANLVFGIVRTSIPVVVTNVLDEYLRNNSTDHPQLNIELYKLRGSYNDFMYHSNFHFNSKQEYYYRYLGSSIDFTRGEVVSYEKIKTLEFKNNIYWLLDNEREFTRLHKQAYIQAVKVKQMINVLK
jgi:hypothetical protein